MRRSISCMLGGLMVVAIVATPALSQGLNRSADLVSPQSGRADPGDLVMDINVTEALPNAFGDQRGAPLFSTSELRTGRSISAGKARPLAVTAGTMRGPTRLTRRGSIPGRGSARLDLSQKGDLPSSGERVILIWSKVAGAR